MFARGTMLSSEVIITLAAEKFIRSVSGSTNELSMTSASFPSSVLGQSGEDSEWVRLVQNLLFCAERVGQKQHERAKKFLRACEKMSSPIGTPIQRLVFYFSEALFNIIAKETGRITPQGLKEKPVDPLEPGNRPSGTLTAFQNENPLSQITKYVGIQAILDHLGKVKRVHIIYLQIRTGLQWMILMQSLAGRSENPIQHLKITAIGTESDSILEETGRQLSSFAQFLNLKLTFKTALAKDILELKEDNFEVDSDEVVAVYAACALMCMIRRVDRLNHFMGLIRRIRPCVMVVTETEANCNSPTFIGRFVESLFFFGAYFDSLADCFQKNEMSRRDAEATWFRSSIRNILAAEGEERKIRHVSLNVWRVFFARFGLEEEELSISYLEQANLVLQSFSCGSSFTLCMDGKCLTIGCKGTPLSSLSVWKFQ